MRITLIQMLIKSFRRYLNGNECRKIMQAMADQLPDYVALELYDMRYRYDVEEEMDEADEAAHTLGINAPKNPERILN